MREIFVFEYYLFLIFTWALYALLTESQVSQLPIIAYSVFLSIRLSFIFYKRAAKKLIVVLDFIVALYSTILIVPFFEDLDDWLLIWVTSLIFIWIIALSSFNNDSCQFLSKILYKMGISHIVYANLILSLYGFISIAFILMECYSAKSFNWDVMVILLPVFWYFIFQIWTNTKTTLFNRAVLCGITNFCLISCGIIGVFYICFFSLFLPINMDVFNDREIISLLFVFSLLIVELIFGVAANIKARNFLK